MIGKEIIDFIKRHGLEHDSFQIETDSYQDGTIRLAKITGIEQHTNWSGEPIGVSTTE